MLLFVHIIVYLTLLAGLLIAIFCRISFLFLAVPFLPAEQSMPFNVAILVLSSLLILSAYHLLRREKFGFFVLNASTVFSVILGAVAIEWHYRKIAPPWPTLLLHGAPLTKGRDGWGRILEVNPKAFGFNSWGQRDLERQVRRNPDRNRFIFVGDSFLEESSTVPVSLLTERRLGKKYEIINLGVSTASPSDYYWRIKRIGKHLLPDHVFLFFFFGNDFMARWGNSKEVQFFAPPPQDSLGGRLLPNLNFHYKGHLLPQIRAWYGGNPNLHQFEQGQLKRCQELGQARVSEFLRGFYSGDWTKLQPLLNQKDLQAVYSLVCKPNAGLFRSYYFGPAFQGMLNPEFRINPPDAPDFEFTFRWLEASKKISEDIPAKFTVVLVPTGFAADAGMARDWSALTDMKSVFSAEEATRSRLLESLKREQIDFIDLLPPLSSEEGTYLNMDGHWSDKGNEIAAAALHKAILERGW